MVITVKTLFNQGLNCYGERENTMETIRITGIRPKDNDLVVGLYSNISIDLVLKLDLVKALNGIEIDAVDIPQITNRLAAMLTRYEDDIELENHPTIALEIIANSVADSVMRTWQIRKAKITVHASLRSEHYDLQSAVDDISISLTRVSKEDFDEPFAIPESAARVAFRSGRVKIDNCEDADYCRRIAEEDEKENQRLENEKAVTAVISMRGVAKQDTRSAMLKMVALLEQDEKSRVDGISALYVVNALEGDYYAATFVLSSSGDELELLSLVRAVAALYKDVLTVKVLGSRSYGAPAADTKTIDPKGLPQNLAEMVIVNPKSPELMPWMQIESDAALDCCPVAYSLALAADTQTVGVYSEQWLIGDDY